MDAALDALAAGRHGDPFSVLGRHGDIVRSFAREYSWVLNKLNGL